MATESDVAPAFTGCSGYVVTVDTAPLELVVVLGGLVCVPVVCVPVVDVVVCVVVVEVGGFVVVEGGGDVGGVTAT